MEQKINIKKEQTAMWISIVLCLLPGFYVLLFWYSVFQAYSKVHGEILTAIVVLVIGYLAFLISHSVLRGIIYYIIK